MKIETIEWIKGSKELELNFPFYMAKHRKWTYAKFYIEYYQYDSLPKNISMIICENGFNLPPFIKKIDFPISKDIIAKEFKYELDNYEHNVSESEYLIHFNDTLSLLNQ